MLDINFPLSETSSREKVASYLCFIFELDKEIQNSLINEYISGDILSLLSDEDFREFGIKLGKRKKIMKFIEDNKSKFKEKEITEKINTNSTKEEVKSFFEKCLEYKGELNALNGKGLFELTEERMKSLGLKLGQRKRLIKYIIYFKELETSLNEEELYITRKSRREEVSKFLKMKINFSEESINNISLDGKSLLDLKEDEINNLEEISLEERKNLKKFLKREHDKREEKKEIQLNLVNSFEDVSKFLKEKLYFSDESIKYIQEQGLDSEIILSLKENEIKELDGISEEEKNILNKYLNELREEKQRYKIRINNIDNKEDQKSLINKEIMEKKEENKNVDIERETNNIDRKIIQANNSNVELNTNKNDKKILEKKVIGKLIDQPIKSDYLQFSRFKNLVINPLIQAPYNLFFFITLSESQEKSASFSIYLDKSSFFSSLYYIIQPNLISKNVYNDYDENRYYFYLFQIPLEKPIKVLYITLIKDENCEFSDFELKTNNIENYFETNDLIYDEYDDSPLIAKNLVFSEYLDYFWDINCDFGEKLQKSLIKALIFSFSQNTIIHMKTFNFFRIVKLCSKYEIEMKNIKNLEILKCKVDSTIYLDDEDIEKIISKEKSKIIEKMISQFIDMDDKYLMKLIKGKCGSNICRSILDMMNDGTKFDNFINNNIEDLYIFQKLLLTMAKAKNEVGYVFTYFNNLIDSLNFIKENIDLLLTKDSECFPISLNPPSAKDDINKIFVITKEIIDKCSENKYKLINMEDLFKKLLDFDFYKDLNDIYILKNFLQFLEKDKFDQNLINTLNKKIHTKGLSLMEKNKLSIEEIFDFIVNKDAFYCKLSNNKSKYRDPEIFKYIPITKTKKDDKEYLRNINFIKNNRLFELFSNQDSEIQNKFYGILLSQMKIMSDLKGIFDIFPLKFIDKSFTILINEKVKVLIYTVLDEEKGNEKNLFEIIDNWLTINFYNNLDLKYNCRVLEINYDFTTKYYSYLIKSQKLMIVINKIMSCIRNFF